MKKYTSRTSKSPKKKGFPFKMRKIFYKKDESRINKAETESKTWRKDDKKNLISFPFIVIEFFYGNFYFAFFTILFAINDDGK
jgi:hypothetical protein